MKEKLRLIYEGNVKKVLGKYKYILIVIVVGMVLLMLPTGSRQSTREGEVISGEAEHFDVEELEEKLSRALSKVSGAGEVSVVLTLHSGMERILATDAQRTHKGTESDIEEKTVVISTDHGEDVVLIGQNYPVFQGALIVCRGGDDPQVQLCLTQAVSALTGLSTGRITVCKGS